MQPGRRLSRLRIRTPLRLGIAAILIVGRERAGRPAAKSNRHFRAAAVDEMSWARIEHLVQQGTVRTGIVISRGRRASRLLLLLRYNRLPQKVCYFTMRPMPVTIRFERR